jgi:serine/threonine protein kinase/tetratricopeptide (TPR) repeat protein
VEEVSESREDSVLGRRLGPYVLRRRIATGGMGVVFDAYHERLEREVALKTLGSGDATREDLARFLNEARAAARLSHPNLVSVFDVGEHNGTRYLAMELVRGRSLYDRIRNEGPLDPTEAVTLTAAACDGLQHAHDKGILHRDLKPANLLLQAPEGTPRITDFGVARAPGNQRLTATGIALGTPNYMSPEQAMGQNDSLDARSDVWGMGAILYEALTGLPPFNCASQLETMQAVVGEALVPPRTHRPEIPEEVEAIVLRCLAKPREKRYPSAFDLAEDLRRTLRGEPVSQAPAEAAHSSRSLLYLLVTTIFVVAMLTSFLGGLFVARRQRLRAPTPSPTSAAAPQAGLESYLARIAQRLDGTQDDASVKDLEAVATLAGYRESSGDATASAPEAFAVASAALRSRLAWRRYELGSEPVSSHLARAASLDPAGPQGIKAWSLLAERVWGQEGSVGQERAGLARRFQRYLTKQGTAQERAQASRAVARASLRLLDFDTASAALEPLESSESDLDFLGRLSQDLSGRERLNGGLNVFANSDLGPCLVTALDQQILIRVPGKRGALAWRGRASVIAAADVLEGGADELLCAENSGGLCSMTLLPLSFEPKGSKGVAIGRYSGSCYGLFPGDVDGDDKLEFLVLTGNPLHLSLLQIDRATRRPRTRLVFPKDEVVPGHWDRGLLLDLDGVPGDEILLASSRPGAKLLGRRAKGSERSRPAAELDLGPVAQLLKFTPSAGQAEEGQERALAVVSAGPQAGIVVIGAGSAGLLEVLGRWPNPQGISSPEQLRVAIFETRSKARLLLRSYQAGSEWVFDAIDLAALEQGQTPTPIEICRSLRSTRGSTAFLAGNADSDSASELVLSSYLFGFGEAKPLEPPASLSTQDAYTALEMAEDAVGAKAFLGTLSPRDKGEAELAWLRLLGRRAALYEKSARISFRTGEPARGADRLREADAILRRVATGAERVAREGDLPPGRRWLTRQLALETAAQLGDWEAAARLVLEASNAERAVASQALDRWQQRAHAQRNLRVQDYDPGDPKRKFAVGHPGRTTLVPGQPTRLRIDSHAEDAIFTELEIEPSSLLEFQFDIELYRGIAKGVVQAGLLEKGAGSTLTTGIELWVCNTTRSNRSGFVRFVVGSQPVSSWIEFPRIRGRLRGKLRVEFDTGGGLVQNEVSLDDALISSYRGRINFRYTLPRIGTLGAVAPANPNAYREDVRFARRGYIDLHRLALGVQGGADVATTREPQTSLGYLARGDRRSALQSLTRALRTQRDPPTRALVLIGRAVAYARDGDLARGLKDLKLAYAQFPHRVVWWLELCGEGLRGPDARLAAAFLGTLARSDDPLEVATSRSLRGDLWTDPPVGEDERSQSLSAYLRFRQPHLATKERYKDAQSYRQFVGNRMLQLPWDAFPMIVSPVSEPLADERFRELLDTSGSILRRYVAYSIAAQGRPSSHEPQLRLGKVFQERKLLGDALAAYRRARELAPRAARASIEVEMAVVLEGLGELPRAAARLQSALSAGAPRQGLASRFPTLAQDPRYKSLFQ